MANPLRNPRLYDVAQIGGITTPGQADILHATSKRKWDIVRGYGLSGARNIYHGLDVKEFILRLQFWEEAQIDEYNDKIVPLLIAPKPGSFAAVLKFYHPHASEPPVNIRSVGIVEAPQMYQVEDGLWQVEISLTPYSGPPKPVVVKPIQASDDRPKPQNERQVLIQKLSDQIQNLANRKPAP